MYIKIKNKSLALFLMLCFMVNVVFSESIIYSLDGLLENNLHADEVMILEKNKKIMKNSLACGFNYKFVSPNLDVNKAEFWSVADLNKDKSYFVIFKKAETEIRRLNAHFGETTKSKQLEIESDFKDCLNYVKSQNMVAPPGGVFHLGVIGSDKFVLSDYLILNDTGFSLEKFHGFDDCKIEHFLTSNPIKKYCLEMFFEAVQNTDN